MKSFPIRRNTLVLTAVLFLLATFAWAGWANWEYRKQAAERLSVSSGQAVLVPTSGGELYLVSYTSSATSLEASDAGVTCQIGLGITRPMVNASTVSKRLIVTASAAGNFSVAHGLGDAPKLAVIVPTSASSIWFQPSPRYDATNVYLCASDAGASCYVEVWG